MAVAAFAATVCVTTAGVSAAEIAVVVAVIDAIGVADKGWSKTPDCTIQHVRCCASSKCKSVMVSQ